MPVHRDENDKMKNGYNEEIEYALRTKENSKFDESDEASHGQNGWLPVFIVELQLHYFVC